MANSLHLSQTQSLQQRLAPQQVQFLKLLQLPLLALEQNIKAELEQNPMLEDVDDIELTVEPEPQMLQEQLAPSLPIDIPESGGTGEIVADKIGEAEPVEYSEFSTYASDDTAGFKTGESQTGEYEDNPAPQIVTLNESLSAQLPLLMLSPEEHLIAEEIIGNLDPDGYLRRPLMDIVEDLNISIHPEVQVFEAYHTNGVHAETEQTDSADHLNVVDIFAHPSVSATPPMFDLATAEGVLRKVQSLDPVGIAARTLQECLTLQITAELYRDHSQELALRILTECFDDFLRKHYELMLRKLNTTEDALRAAMEEIHKLNPKPGNTTYGTSELTVIPDFTVERDESDLLITLNDQSVPQVRINRQYQNMLEQGRSTRLPRDARTFLRQKFDSAKMFITALQQRRVTMMKTMRAIAELQRDFFFEGEQALKPLFYRHVAERIGVDVSTVCRVVNGKYVQCDWGIYELRYFFSDSITTDEGIEISNRVIKTRIKDMIEAEDQKNPLSDDEIARLLNAEGFNIARRTVAKYREAQQIPVARLRRGMGIKES